MTSDTEREYQLYRQEEGTYYEVCLQAFINSAFERNKQLLIISYLSVGLLFIFIGQLTNELYVVLWFATLFGFVMNIIVLLHIMSLNRQYFKGLLDIENNKVEMSDAERKIARVSYFSISLFCLGIGSGITLAAFMALNQLV